MIAFRHEIIPRGDARKFYILVWQERRHHVRDGRWCQEELLHTTSDGTRLESAKRVVSAEPGASSYAMAGRHSMQQAKTKAEEKIGCFFCVCPQTELKK